MGYDKYRYQTGVKAIRIASDRLLLPSEVAGRITNFRNTPEGTLISVEGPTPFLPDYKGAFPSYDRTHGIFHGTIAGRNLFLLHHGTSVYSFYGSRREWVRVVGPAGLGALVIQNIPDHNGPQFPCQFCMTPRGIVIVPQNGRAVMYDGEVALPLGYAIPPSAPIGYGPTSSGTTVGADVNDGGYDVSRVRQGLGEQFGYGRLGTAVSDLKGNRMGGAAASSYQAAVQWINYFMDVSPISARSSEVHWLEQYGSESDCPDNFLREVLWTNLATGPDGTIGRIVSRTRDIVNSGTDKLFEIPQDCGAGNPGSFATVPDNISTAYPDNVPDSWLVAEPVDVMPVPQFRLCCMAFGRLWAANTPGEPGLLVPSRVGQYGSFEEKDVMFPDPEGGEITGLYAVGGDQGGLLAFTRTSTYIVMPSDDGQGFRSMSLHSRFGCVAPNSIQSLPDGSVVWLGVGNFFRFDGKEIVSVSGDKDETVRRINPVRALQSCAAYSAECREYRCWVPLDGAIECSTCLVYDGEGWKDRNDVSARGACVTRGDRELMIVCGQCVDSGGTTRDGVWVVDRASRTYTPAARTAILETCWIEAVRSENRTSPKLVKMWLRETSSGTATIKAWRDWRQGSQSDYPSAGLTCTTDLDPPSVTPPEWGTTTWNQTGAEWVKRRPFWERKSIFLPSCETYKVQISSTSRIEIVALSFDEQPQPGSARIEGGP